MTTEEITFPLVELTVPLPALRGSAKQCTWADSIRRGYLNDAQGVILYATSEARRTNADPQQFAIGRADLVARCERLAAVADAKWWIDVARFQTVHTLLRGA